MRVLAIGKLSGGIRQHILNIRKNSRTEYLLLSYGTSGDGEYTAPTLNVPGLRAISFTITGLFCALNLIQKKKIDAIHAHYLLPAGLVGALASMASGKKLYLTAHGTDVYRTRWLDLLKRIVCMQAERTICVSRSLEAELKGMGIKNTVTIYNGATQERAKKARMEKPAVLFAGALTRNKAGMLNGIIEAVKNRNRKIQFYVAGEGQLRIEGAKMLGNIPHNELWGYYRAADALVSCSDYEGFSLVILEAQTAGLPVVGRKNTAQEELLSGGRGLFAETPQEFADQIERILKDKKLRDRMTARAKRSAKGYTWKRTALETEKAYGWKTGWTSTGKRAR